MKKSITFGVLVFILSSLLVFAGGNVDPKADQLLRGMSDLLANAKSFSFNTSEIHDRHQRSGKSGKLEFGRKVVLQRPNGIRMEGTGAQGKQASVWYDGKTVVLQSDAEKVFGKVEMPPTLDEAIDYAAVNLDIPMPMADIFYSSPYNAFVGPDTKGSYVKTEKIEDVDCAQLSFQDQAVDWRIWIAESGKPVLCQLEITYKDEPDQPKSLMTFRDWNFDPKVDSSTFAHTPPEGYTQIPILGYAAVSETQPKPEKEN